jgi:hypothetical protein
MQLLEVAVLQVTVRPFVTHITLQREAQVIISSQAPLHNKGARRALTRQDHPLNKRMQCIAIKKDGLHVIVSASKMAIANQVPDVLAITV